MESEMRNRALSAHAVLLRHPWAALLMMSRVNVGPNMLRYVDATVGTLRNRAFSWALADHAWNSLDACIYGFTLHRLNFPFQPQDYAGVAEEFLEQMPMDEYPHLLGLAKEVIGGRHDDVQHFDLALTLLLDGFDRLRAAEAGG